MLARDGSWLLARQDGSQLTHMVLVLQGGCPEPEKSWHGGSSHAQGPGSMQGAVTPEEAMVHPVMVLGQLRGAWKAAEWLSR